MSATFLGPMAFVADSAAMGRAWTLEESLAYNKWLATSHYENFQVVSFLLPKRLHQDFHLSTKSVPQEYKEHKILVDHLVMMELHTILETPNMYMMVLILHATKD